MADVNTNTNPPMGWYPDPASPESLRYWDGKRWTEQRMRRNATEPQRDTGPKRGLPFLGRRRRADLEAEIEQLRSEADALRQLNGELELTIDRLGLHEAVDIERQMARLRDQLAEMEERRAEVARELAAARAEVVALRDTAEMQEIGLYKYHHPAEDSVALGERLSEVRSQFKELARKGGAVQVSDSFTFNNSLAKGRQFSKKMATIMLRAYNAEAENCVKSVKAGNLETAVKRLSKAREVIARQGEWIDLRITDHYHRLRIEELRIASDYWMKKQEEKEAERAHREELRQQRQAEKELQAERDRLAKERAHYENALAALLASGDEEGAAKLREKLADVDKAIEDVDYRAANVRAGYVYVISNIGAFGPDVVKIGMTRRLEPMDRVNELGDASVPFRFDVHTLFFAEDAVAIENELHRHFEDRRINRVNLRREFFRATPQEVLEVLKDKVGVVTEFTAEPVADEYRLSIGETDDTF